MTWHIVWTDEALRQASRLDKPVASRIVAKIESVAAEPARFFRRLKGSDDYRLRVGDYRVLALIDSARKRLIIEAVGHRSIVYRRH